MVPTINILIFFQFSKSSNFCYLLGEKDERTKCSFYSISGAKLQRKKIRVNSRKKLEEIGRNWGQKIGVLEETGRNWKKLEEIGRNWKSQFSKVWPHENSLGGQG
jgi:hypothetical protein